MGIDPFFAWKAVGRAISNMPSRADRQQTQQLVREARDWFRELGVAEHEGTGKLKVEHTPFMDNAGYIPPVDPVTGVPLGPYGDKMVVGARAKTEWGGRGKQYGNSPDVVRHEFTHRIVSHLLPHLDIKGHQGAIHESLADTFALAMDPNPGDWVLGEDVHKGGVRSMGAPEVAEGERRTAPAHIDKVSDSDDPHRIANVANKAAYLIGTQPGIGKQGLARLYMHAVRNNLSDARDLTDFASGVYRSAEQLLERPEQRAAVRDAWKAVGIDPAASARS